MHESTKENKDIPHVCDSNKDSVYDTIEGDDDYPKSPPFRKIWNLPYTKYPDAHSLSKEDENTSNVYFDILE